MKAVARGGAERARNGRGGRPSKAREGEISDHILTTAAVMFAGQGYAATSVERVAAACGAGKDTIYRRYPSKRALFDAVVNRLRASVLTKLDALILAQHGDPITRLMRIARWFLSINLDPELVALKRIAASEAVIEAGASEPALPDPIFQRLVDLVAEAQRTGDLRSGEAEFVALQLIHAVATGPSTEAMLGGTTYASQAAQDAYFERAWALFLTGAGRP